MRDPVNNNYSWLVCALMLTLFAACDTDRNIGNPDLHYFVKYYGGDGNQEGVDMQALNDGSFLLLGNYIRNDFDRDIYLVRVDAEGEILWEKTLSTDKNSTARDIEPTNDGNYIILSDYLNGIQRDFQLLKVSPDGVPLDSVDACGTVADETSRTVTPLEDGGFIVSGATDSTAQWSASSPGNDPGDTFSYRFDAGLRRLTKNEWFPVYQGFGSEEGDQLDVAVKTIQRPPTALKPEGYFYVFGYTSSNLSNSNPNGRLVFFYHQRGSEGKIEGIFDPGTVVDATDTDIQFVQPVASALGTGYMVIGTLQDDFGNSVIYLARLRDSFTFQFQNDFLLSKTIPLNRNIRGVAATNAVVGEVGYLVVGNEVRSTGALNIWLSKVDQSGTVRWSSTFGSEAEEDTAAAVLELADGKIVVLGTMGLADNQRKMAFIKLNPTGKLLE